MLENGAPAGIYDDCGTSALSLMIEKMPAVAKEALGQFLEVDNALRRKYFHLNYLETEYWRALGSNSGRSLRQSFARTPLQVSRLSLVIIQVVVILTDLNSALWCKSRASYTEIGNKKVYISCYI